MGLAADPFHPLNPAASSGATRVRHDSLCSHIKNAAQAYIVALTKSFFPSDENCRALRLVKAHVPSGFVATTIFVNCVESLKVTHGRGLLPALLVEQFAQLPLEKRPSFSACVRHR